MKHRRSVFEITFHAKQKQTKECDAVEESGEIGLYEAAGAEGRIRVVDRVAAGDENEKGADQVDQNEMGKKKVGLVEGVEASLFQQCDQKGEVECDAGYD